MRAPGNGGMGEDSTKFARADLVGPGAQYQHVRASIINGRPIGDWLVDQRIYHWRHQPSL